LRFVEFTMVHLVAEPSTLRYRLATRNDIDILLKLRAECGWGEDKIRRFLGHPDKRFCLFTLDDGGEERVVGMGGWYLEIDDDPETASKARHTVYLSKRPLGLAHSRARLTWQASLFIRKAYQKLRLGTRAMDLLEQAAKEEFGAEWITLDALRWQCERDENDIWVEKVGVDATTPKWYAARGYLPYRVSSSLPRRFETCLRLWLTRQDPEPKFPHPTKDDPDYKLTAVFLKKAT
jgi:GNAT superfamily N-acetyltransferase